MERECTTTRSRAAVEDVLLRWRREKLLVDNSAPNNRLATAQSGGTATEEDVDPNGQRLQPPPGKKRGRRDQQAAQQQVKIEGRRVSQMDAGAESAALQLGGVSVIASMDVLHEEVVLVTGPVEVAVVTHEPRDDHDGVVAAAHLETTCIAASDSDKGEGLREELSAAPATDGLSPKADSSVRASRECVLNPSHRTACRWWRNLGASARRKSPLLSWAL
jgi:hypothetical protein